MDATIFWVGHRLQLPGLGALVLPTTPSPTWLATLPLHAALRLQLRRPGHNPLALVGTAEKLTTAPPEQLPLPYQIS